MNYSDSVANKLFNEMKEVACSKLQLIQNDSEKPCIIEGGGYLKANAEGQIIVKIFAPIIQNNLSGPIGWFGGVPGKLYPKSRFFQLNAVDSSDQKWTAESVIPMADDFHNCSISGPVRELRHVTELLDDTTRNPMPFTPGYGDLNLYFGVDVDLPSNAFTETHKQTTSQLNLKKTNIPASLGSFVSNILKLSANGCDFELCREEGGFSVHAHSATSFTEDLAMRIEESLQFILGKTVYWKVARLFSNGGFETRIRSVPNLAKKSHYMPPLQFPSSSDPRSGYICKLFCCYFEFVSNIRQNYHPCTVHLYNAIQASSSSSEAFALALSVAIEGICKSQFGSIARPSKAELDLIDKLNALIKTFPDNFVELSDKTGASRLISRVEGALANFKNSRAYDQLTDLSRSGSIEMRHANMWKKLRNQSAHAELVDPAKRQEHVDARHSGIVLLYQLIFTLIGYEGVFSDYSAASFPERYYKRGCIGPIPPIA